MRPLVAFIEPVLVVALALGARAAGDVIVVKAGSNLQAAINSAKEGDTILIESGTYAPVLLGDKELQVVADSGASVVIQGSIQASSLSAGKHLVLSGLAAQGAGGASFAQRVGLHASAMAGRLRLQDCTFAAQPDHPGAYAANCADACFTRCLSNGGEGVTITQANAPGTRNCGLEGQAAILTVFDGFSIGGQGRDNPSWDAGNGGDGAHLQGGELFASGSRFLGGDGGKTNQPCAFAGDGGDGIEMCAPQPGTALLLSNLYEFGIGPQAPMCFTCISCFWGHNGVALRFTCSQPTILNFHATVLDAPAVARELTSLPLAIYGRAGEHAYLLISTETERVYVPAWKGVRMVAAPLLRRIDLGLIPQGAVLQTQIPLPDLGPGVQSRTWFLQPLLLSPIDGLHIGSLRTLVILDQAF